MLRNDGHLTESGIDFEFDVEEGTQHESNSMQVKLLDKLIGDAKHVGILSQARVTLAESEVSLGSCSLHKAEDDSILNMHGTYMAELRKNKRPALPV